MINEVDRVSLLINNFVNLARQKESRQTVLNLNDLLDEIALLYSKVAENKGISLSVKVQGSLWLLADEQQLRQILINLLTNACKHTSSGTIELRSSLTSEPGFVTFSVTDSGTGIPPEQAEHIFERFTKLDEFVQGTGLGLSICRDIAGRMGARVLLDTDFKGPGARFLFVVPVTPSQETNKTA